jgi:hypothetical protein
MVDVEAEPYPDVDFDPRFSDVEAFVDGLRERIGEHPILIYSGAWYWHGYLGNPSLKNIVDNYQAKVWNAHYVSGAGYASVLYKSVPKVWWTKNCWGGRGLRSCSSPPAPELPDNTWTPTLSPARARSWGRLPRGRHMKSS